MLKIFKRLTLPIVLSGLALFCLIILFHFQAQDGQAYSVNRSGSGRQESSPIVLEVNPDEIPNNLDFALMITGTDFQAELSGTQILTRPMVFLGDFSVSPVNWVNSTTLTATVPWGLEAGVYTITVINPDGSVAALQQALTVTQAIGVWTTDGPYGGQIRDIAVSPVTSNTAFAAVTWSGLYRTENAGREWDLVFPDSAAMGTTFGPSPTNALYYWGTGLHRSVDGGETWSELAPGMIQAFAINPINPDQLWIAHGKYVYYSPDNGSTWEERGTGLPTGVETFVFAVNPADPSVVFAGMQDGRVYKTVDGGAEWQLSSTGLSAPDTNYPAMSLAFHPQDPNVLLYSRMHDQVANVYRSVDGGNTWDGQTGLASVGGVVSDIAFSTQVSGTVYASTSGPPLIASYDGGLTWITMTTNSPGSMYALGLDPQSQLPAYLGGWSKGTFHSWDGGKTWQLSTEGIAALLVTDISVFPTHPEIAYVACGSVAIFGTDTAGYRWRQIGTTAEGQPISGDTVAVDPFHSASVYIAGGGVPPEVYRNGGNIETWERIPLPMEGSGMMSNIVVSPKSPAVLFAGGSTFNFDDERGLIFRSVDYGETWTELNFSRQISMVSSIAVNPFDDQILYMSTYRYNSLFNQIENPGLGVFRGDDRGQSWIPVVKGIGHFPVWSLAINPENPQIIYAGGWLSDTQQAAVFKSINGGDSWTAVDLDLSFGGIPDLAIDPLSPDTIYAATEQGLYRSDNAGVTWRRTAGALGAVHIQRLGIAASDDRTILYVGTIGGFSSSQSLSSQADGDFVQSGVYQQTILHLNLDKKIYLPLVSGKNQ